MFKLTRGGSGLRRSSGRGGSMPSRVNWGGQSPIRNASAPELHKPAFLPTNPVDQIRDTKSPRVNEAN